MTVWRRRHRRTHAALVACALAVGWLLSPSPPPAAAANGPCPGTTGVTVVVDFQALGGGVVVRCAPSSPATGFKALTSAGFSIEEVRNVPGFLCRIDGRPDAAQDSCINTPPATAYWSYWHASRGGMWVASQEGGKTRTPPPGSVDGWSFSDDGSAGPASPPGIDPPAASATPKPATPKPATPKPATPAPATPTPTPTARPTVARPTAAASPSALLTAAVSAQTTASGAIDALASPSEMAASPPATQTPLIGGAAAPSVDPGLGSAGLAGGAGGGPPPGTLLGAGLVLAIAAGAVLARARRTRGRAPGA